MITVFWGARHGQGVTTTLVQSALALLAEEQSVKLVDADPDAADLALFYGQGTPPLIDTLIEEAEQHDITWPSWGSWYKNSQAVLGNTKRQFPLLASPDAAKRVVSALESVDTPDAHILCDIGSGLRDYLTVAFLSIAHRVVVVSKTELPDAIATQTALSYVSPRLQAEDRVIALLGQGSATAEILRNTDAWRSVKIPETQHAARMRGTGQIVLPKQGTGLLEIVNPNKPQGKGRSRWLSRS